MSKRGYRRPISSGNGPTYTARRIELAAERIRQIAATPQDDEDWKAVELRKRRKGLIKAIGFFRRRYGEGITSYL